MKTFYKFTLTPYTGEVWIDVTKIEGIVEYHNHTIISTRHNKYDVKEKASEIIEKLSRLEQ